MLDVDAEALRDFRDTVRTALAAPSIRAAIARLDDVDPDARPLYRLLGAERLLAVDWPERFGGRGLGLVEAGVMVDELALAGIPDTLHLLSIQVVGRLVLEAGTDAQRASWLPALARGDTFAAVLFSEPGAGTDLAGLATEARACARGGYRLYGRKVYGLETRFADVGLCAARSQRGRARFEGISLFLVPLRHRDVEVRVLPSIADAPFHDVRLHGVHVDDGARLGPLHQAWPLIARSVAFERTGMDYCIRARHWYEAALTAAAASTAPGATLAGLGRLGAELECARLLSWRVLSDAERGAVDDATAATAKWYASELAKRIAYWGHDRAAASNGTHGDAAVARAARMLESAAREAPGLTLSGGTSELMLRTLSLSDHP